MERIIAGRFQTKGDADAVAALMAQYVDTADICIFQNNPPGQHDAYVVGGDEDEDPGAAGAGESAASTGQPVVSSNIKTLVDDWQKDGSIGTSHPPTKKKAIKQAVAVALVRTGNSRNIPKW